MVLRLIASPQRSPSPGVNGLQTPSNRGGGPCFEVIQKRGVILGSYADPTQAVSLDVSGMADINGSTSNTVGTSLHHCHLAALVSPPT